MSHTRTIQRRVLEYFRAHQRDLPWRRTRDPYAIWVSEVMLQQTRVATVVPYFERWLRSFPTLAALAGAPLDDVLSHWSGLGYYSRARNLHRGAREALARYGGRLPDSAAALRELPGIGRYTAGAIASQAFGEVTPVVDGNVARVLARLFAIELDVKSARGQRELWDRAADLVPDDHPGDFNQGLMELGATVCTPRSPSCLTCPLSRVCEARKRGLQAELPIVPRRKRAAEKDELRHHAVWAFKDGSVLLARRRPSGLFGGLWELPQAGDLPGLGAALGRDVHVVADRPLMVHRQELSHRLLTITVWPARVDGRSRPPAGSPYDRVRWQALARSVQLGLSSATQRIMDAASKDQTWTIATRQ